jgi:hypothetical protein
MSAAKRGRKRRAVFPRPLPFQCRNPFYQRLLIRPGSILLDASRRRQQRHFFETPRRRGIACPAWRRKHRWRQGSRSWQRCSRLKGPPRWRQIGMHVRIQRHQRCRRRRRTVRPVRRKRPGIPAGLVKPPVRQVAGVADRPRTAVLPANPRRSLHAIFVRGWTMMALATNPTRHTERHRAGGAALLRPAPRWHRQP